MKFAWIDLRTVPSQQLEAVVAAAVHARIAGVVSDDPALLGTLPPTVRKVLLGPESGDADVVTVTVDDVDHLDGLIAAGHTGAVYVEVRDDRTLRLACTAAARLPWTIVSFTDPTKIPLEIVIAAADRADGKLICVVGDIEEATIVLDVLEHGSDGLLLAPRDANEVFQLARLLEAGTQDLTLSTLTVDRIEHVGLGDRFCVDTCSHFEQD